MGALAANRQSAAMPQTPVRSHFNEAFNIQRKLFAQIAFYRAFVFDQGADPVDLVLGQVSDLLFVVDAGAVKQR